MNRHKNIESCNQMINTFTHREELNNNSKFDNLKKSLKEINKEMLKNVLLHYAHVLPNDQKNIDCMIAEITEMMQMYKIAHKFKSTSDPQPTQIL